MIILIDGTTHSGKTKLAQSLLEKYKYPYLSIDHLKMGLIRSGNTSLTPMDDEKLTDYLWPIVREMIKTAIENQQNLIVEGAYFPSDWSMDLDAKYLKEIKYFCLILSEQYIKEHFEDIQEYANVIEKRMDDYVNMNELIADNQKKLEMCMRKQYEYILIDKKYEIEIHL